MSFNRNESSQQRTFAFKSENTIIKENHNLSQEHVTVFTLVSSSPQIQLKPKFALRAKRQECYISVVSNWIL